MEAYVIVSLLIRNIRLYNGGSRARVPYRDAVAARSREEEAQGLLFFPVNILFFWKIDGRRVGAWKGTHDSLHEPWFILWSCVGKFREGNRSAFVKRWVRVGVYRMFYMNGSFQDYGAIILETLLQFLYKVASFMHWSKIIEPFFFILKYCGLNIPW